MGFQDEISSDLDSIFLDGQVAAYTQSEKIPEQQKNITVYFLKYERQYSDEYFRAAVSQEALVCVRVLDIEEPKPGDKIDLDPNHEWSYEDIEKYKHEGVEDIERIWTVQEIIEGNGLVWVLQVRRDLRPTLRS